MFFLALISQSLNSRGQEKDLPKMPAKAYNNVSPATVKIVCNKGEKTGSGVIVGITPYGRALILTASHVVAKEFGPDLEELEFYEKLAVKIPTEILFDNEISPGATVLEIFTPDRPALLHDIGRTLAKLGCNLEVALIDTEGGKAIDVFYLTHENAKLSPKFQARVRKALRKSLP